MESNKSENEVVFEINDTICQKLVEEFVVNIWLILELINYLIWISKIIIKYFQNRIYRTFETNSNLILILI
jgi:hypothetical protein